MISLQVSHSNHSRLCSEIIKKELSETNEQTRHETPRQKSPNSPPPPSKSALSEPSDRESQVISSIKAAGSRVRQELQSLIEDYKDSAEKLMLNHGYDPEKEAAIREHLSRLQREKQQRKEKFERDLARLEAKKLALQQKPHHDEKEREERRKSIEARIQRVHQRERRRHEEEANFIKFYEEYKAQKPKFKQMEEQFAKKAQQEKQEQMKALRAKVQQTYKPMDLEELTRFEEEYEAGRHQAHRLRLQNQLAEKKKAETNEARLSQLYKGHSHSLVIRELEQRQAKTDEPRQKLRRIRQYSQVVREEHRPTALNTTTDDAEESESSETPQTERGRRVLKERFLHGQFLGKKVEFQKNPLSHSEQQAKGLQYLEFLKQLPKKPKKKAEIAVTVPQPKPTTARVYRVVRERNPLYQGRRYNSIDFGPDALRDGEGVRRMLAVMRQRRGQLQLEQRLMKHRSYEDRQDFMTVQKDHNQHIYNGIKQKLAILSQL